MTYSTDLTDRQFNLIKKFLPKVKLTKPPIYSKKELLNAILYVTKTGCQWRMIPKDYPPFRTVHKYFRRLCRLGVMENILFNLNNIVIKKQLVNRKNNSLKLIIDSKSVDTAEYLKQRFKGYDGHKKCYGVKLFKLIDQNNLCWRTMVLPANTPEVKGAERIIQFTFDSKKHPIVKFIIGDKGFASRELEERLFQKYGICLLSLEKKHNRKFQLPEDEQRYQYRKQLKKLMINPDRYKVEQSFAHTSQARRLTRVYERYSKSYETFVNLRHLQLVLKKLMI
jgi:putative transposase